MLCTGGSRLPPCEASHFNANSGILCLPAGKKIKKAKTKKIKPNLPFPSLTSFVSCYQESGRIIKLSQSDSGNNSDKYEGGTDDATEPLGPGGNWELLVHDSTKSYIT